MTQNAEAKDIDQRIAFKAFVKVDFATYRRDPDAISVMSDSANDAREQAPVGGQLRR